MSHLELTDREIERVLAGHQPPGRPDLGEVAYLFARLRTMGDFEQAPPMSPRLLAELDASEVDHRPQVDRPSGRPVAIGQPRRDRRERGRQDRPAHARRTGSQRRRWPVVGAAAAVAVLGGLLVLRAQAGGDRPPTEVAGTTDDKETSQTETTAAPTTTTTASTTTTAPPTTTTTTPTTTTPPTTEAAPAPQPPAEPEGPWNGGNLDLDEWCDRYEDDGRRDEWDEFCDYVRRNDGHDGPTTQSGP